MRSQCLTTAGAIDDRSPPCGIKRKESDIPSDQFIGNHHESGSTSPEVDATCLTVDARQGAASQGESDLYATAFLSFAAASAR